MDKAIKLLALVAFLASCEMEAIVDSDHEPVLYLDAVFYSGETLPLMTIGKSANLPGSGLYLLDSSSFFVNNAEITLLWNGVEVEIEQKGKGQYQGKSNAFIQPGDRFEISVRDGSRRASAIATVPDIDVNQFKLEATAGIVELDSTWIQSTETETVIMDDYEYQDRIDTVVWMGKMGVKYTLPGTPDFSAILVNSQDELSILESGSWEYVYRNDWFAHELYEYDYLLGEDYLGFEDIFSTRAVFIYVGSKEEITDQPIAKEVHYDYVIPEPIYKDYHEIYNNNLSPITITNVEGGVGLFIGAVKGKGTQSVEISITEGNNDINFF